MFFQYKNNIEKKKNLVGGEIIIDFSCCGFFNRKVFRTCLRLSQSI